MISLYFHLFLVITHNTNGIITHIYISRFVKRDFESTEYRLVVISEDKLLIYHPPVHKCFV